MEQFTGISLKTRLYALVLAAFIPVTALIVYVAEEQKALVEASVLHRTKLLAQGAAETDNLQIEAARQLLSALARAFLLVDGRPERISTFLSNLPSQTEGYAAFGILNPQGQLVTGSGLASEGPDYARRPWFTTVLKHKRPAIGSYHGEHIDGAPVLYFAQPIFDSRREITAVAFTALDLNHMNRRLFKQITELPPGSRVTLVDQQQVLLRHMLNTDRWSAGPPLDPAVRQRIDSQASGVLIAPDEQGRSKIYAFAHLKNTIAQRRMVVVLEIPRATAMAASRRIFTRNLALLVVSALLAVFSIWWAANTFILRRVRAMVHASRRLAAGDFRVRIGRIGIRDEVSHLAGVFDEMAESLQMRIEREEQVMTSLQHSREQLRRLTAYQNDVREQERIRIARDIHDQLGQSLTILKMDLAWLRKHLPTDDSAVSDKMAAMVQLIGEAMDKLHAVTAELRPVILDDFGLAAAIEWQTESFRQRSGISCRFQNNGYEPDLPKDQATALFRIFQEILTNIMRHAEADDVVVRLEESDGALRLQVTDNGRGITAEEIDSPHAFGLLGIRERLYPLGGRVTFEGKPGKGTRVIVHLPLDSKGDTP